MTATTVAANDDQLHDDGFGPDPASSWRDQLITGFIVIAPLLALVAAVGIFWHHGIGWFDLGLAVALYVVTGLGISL